MDDSKFQTASKLKVSVCIIVSFGNEKVTPPPTDLREQYFNSSLFQERSGNRGLNKRHMCHLCGHTSDISNLTKHMKRHHEKVECPNCNLKIKKTLLKRHLRRHQKFVTCHNCQNSIAEDKLNHHLILCNFKIDHKLCNRSNVEEIDCDSSSINGFFKRWDLPIENTNMYEEMLSDVCRESKEILDGLLQAHPVKAQVIINIGFSHTHPDGGDVYTEATFRTICEALLIGDNIHEYLSRVKDQHRMSIESFERLASGWNYEHLISAHLEAAKFNPLTSGSHIKVPPIISKMRSTLNIHSTDNRCLLYCLLAKKCMVDDKIASKQAKAQGLPEPKKKLPPKGYLRQSSSSYLVYEKELNMTDINFPVKMNDISKIEDNNNLSISIFEWDYNLHCVIPLRHGRGEGMAVELLYLEQGDNSHLILVKDFNSFMLHRTKRRNCSYHCLKCLYGYRTEEQLADHMKLCNQRIYQTTRMPEAGHIQFDSHWKGVRKIFYIYADFETKLLPVKTVERNPYPTKRKINKQGKAIKVKDSHTDEKQIHAPVSYSIVTGSTLNDYVETSSVYSHENENLVSKMFIADLNRIRDDMMTCYKNNQYPIVMSDWDEADFQSSRICHICKRKLDWNNKNNFPVRDHDHFKKEQNFRGGAHNTCNLNYWEKTKKIVVFFHNMPYDLNNFLLDLIKNVDDESDIKIIPQNLEKFKAIYTKHFIFLDSFNFLTSSLETLVTSLKDKGCHNFKRLRKHFPEHYELLMQKGHFPYDYVSDFDVFSESSLPPKEAFDNALNESKISDNDYIHAQRVWTEMGCQTFKDYMEIYVLSDSLLLFDVFESFRDLCLDYYGLDPCHYMSLPAIGYDAMLKMTGVKIEKITDPDMYNFLFENLRGGITTISQRFAKANNPYLLDYDKDQPTTFIQYVDVNNLLVVYFIQLSLIKHF